MVSMPGRNRKNWQHRDMKCVSQRVTKMFPRMYWGPLWIRWESSERAKAIAKRRKEIEKAAEKENPGMRAEVAEMFAGKSYVLFLYTYIRDVRLVFAPPSSIGNFGGDVDNWEWPRHTGDFSFMRAYVSKDGKTAEYSPGQRSVSTQKVHSCSTQRCKRRRLCVPVGLPRANRSPQDFFVPEV